MTTIEFLYKLNETGIKLFLDGERLRYRTEKGALTPELKSQIKARKAEIVTFLKGAEVVTDKPGDTINPGATQ